MDAPWHCLSVRAGHGRVGPDEVSSHVAMASSSVLEANASVLSCIDGRESRRVHGTPGGDFGEFLLALSVVDDATGGGYFLSEDRVTNLMRSLAFLKGSFYMATDTSAVDRLDASLAHRGFSLEESERQPPEIDDVLLAALTSPDHVGCRPVRMALQNPAVYGVRLQLTHWAITSFFRLMWTPDMEKRMQLVIFTGSPNEQAVVQVQSCHLVAPWHNDQVFVVHPGVVQAHRERIAHWLEEVLQREMGVHEKLHAHKILAAMNARAQTQLQLTLDALASGLPVVSARTDGKEVELFASAASATAVGPVLLGKEVSIIDDLTPVDMQTGEHKSQAFMKMNPFHKVPTLRVSDGTTLGESNAILRFLALKYGARHLYPGAANAGVSARIDFALDSFVNEVYTARYTKVVYPAMGFATAPEDQKTENVKLEEALAQWAEKFLADRFVGGEVPCIADFKVAPFFFACASEAVAFVAGFQCPSRIRTFVGDFKRYVPAASMLEVHPNEATIGSILESKLPKSMGGTDTGSVTRADGATGRPIGLLLGDKAPDFRADTTHGRMRFHDFIDGSWAILFSHPDDFTPVCTTELGSVAQLLPQFTARGVKVIALSCNDTDSHNRWGVDVLSVAKLPTDRGFPYPIIADPKREIATMLGMLDGTNPQPGLPMTCRAVFVFAPDKTLKLSLLYPASSGRNFGEILRAIDSLQLTAKHKVATPANWMPGKSCMVLPTVSDDEALRILPKGFSHQQVPSGKRYLRITPDPSS